MIVSGGGVKMMNEYMIVHESNVCSLEKRVNELIRDGCVPQGGIAVVTRRLLGTKYTETLDGVLAFYQAMVRP
jgi:hypothetical protein